MSAHHLLSESENHALHTVYPQNLKTTESLAAANTTDLFLIIRGRNGNRLFVLRTQLTNLNEMCVRGMATAMLMVATIGREKSTKKKELKRILLI